MQITLALALVLTARSIVSKIGTVLPFGPELDCLFPGYTADDVGVAFYHSPGVEGAIPPGDP